MKTSFRRPFAHFLFISKRNESRSAQTNRSSIFGLPFAAKESCFGRRNDLRSSCPSTGCRGVAHGADGRPAAEHREQSAHSNSRETFGRQIRENSENDWPTTFRPQSTCRTADAPKCRAFRAAGRTLVPEWRHSGRTVSRMAVGCPNEGEDGGD